MNTHINTRADFHQSDTPQGKTWWGQVQTHSRVSRCSPGYSRFNGDTGQRSDTESGTVSHLNTFFLSGFKMKNQWRWRKIFLKINSHSHRNLFNQCHKSLKTMKGFIHQNILYFSPETKSLTSDVKTNTKRKGIKTYFLSCFSWDQHYFQVLAFHWANYNILWGYRLNPLSTVPWWY